MNFFQKLTGSLKMPMEDDVFSQKSPIEEEQKISAQDQPRIIQEELTLPEETSKPETKPVSFKEMFANTNTANVEDNENMEKKDPTNLAVAQLAVSRTQTNGTKALKKGLSKLRIGRKEEQKEELSISSPEGQLAIDVYETSEEVVIKSTIAGVKSEDLDVGIEDNTVNIRGSRHNEERVKGEDYFYQECYWGTFSRSVILPVEIDDDEAQASLKDGILTIRLPKIRKEKEKKIKILS